ncbi:glycosyltransferase family 4 protein [Winogradskyella sp. Asnod2-B02-A]|uniref:glycosyltransferase family 4 protein n=1 Tax=Winogradskyella sp. Asnod2-B02-A TaxID=3160583 RepID=UPI003870B8D2
MHKASKIVFVMPWHISERGGGAEVQANYLAKELLRRGYHVSYICQTNHANKINSVENLDGVSIHWLKPSGKIQWLDQNKYLKPLKLIDPNYVIQRLTSNVSYVISKYSSKTKAKYIWICTDNKNPFRNYHLGKFKEHWTIGKIGVIKYSIFYLSNVIMDYYRNIGMKGIDIAFTQNEFQKTRLKENFGRDSFRMISGHPAPSHRISNTDRFNNKTILWCANFGRHKRPEMFIKLAKMLKTQNYKLIMVGGHSDKNYVASLLANKVQDLEVTGTLSFDDALAYFDQASIFVNTSTPGGDGFPNTFIQAWLRQIPVVSLGFDPDNIIQKNNLGYVAKDIEDAKEFITQILSNYEMYKSTSLSAFEYSEKNHTIERMTDNFIQSINSN